MTRLFSFLWVLILIVSCSTPLRKADPCLEKRSALEMGSNRIKFAIAEVNFCTQKISKEIIRKDWTVEQDKTVLKEPDGSTAISDTAKDATLEVVKSVKIIMKQHSVDIPPVIVATGIFREVKGTKPLFEKIQEILANGPRVISAIEEARLGVNSLIATEMTLPDDFLVWDIGGNSMQITIKHKGEKKYFLGGKGSQFFKQTAKDMLRRQNTPNPILDVNLAKLNKVFKNSHNYYVKQIPALPSNVVVYGIGALHSKSILNRINEHNENRNKFYTLDELKGLIKSTVNLTDEQIGGAYASNQVTNQIFVANMMEQLMIQKVNVRELDLTAGLLVFGVSL